MTLMDKRHSNALQVLRLTKSRSIITKKTSLSKSTGAESRGIWSLVTSPCLVTRENFWVFDILEPLKVTYLNNWIYRFIFFFLFTIKNLSNDRKMLNFFWAPHLGGQAGFGPVITWDMRWCCGDARKQGKKRDCVEWRVG